MVFHIVRIKDETKIDESDGTRLSEQLEYINEIVVGLFHLKIRPSSRISAKLTGLFSLQLSHSLLQLFHSLHEGIEL